MSEQNARQAIMGAFGQTGVTMALARAHVDWYQAFVDAGVEPEQADKMVVDTINAILSQVLPVIPKILDAVKEILETPAVEETVRVLMAEKDRQ
jgi:hypothetical protein